MKNIRKKKKMDTLAEAVSIFINLVSDLVINSSFLEIPLR